jgi:hypothetical protein
MPNSLAAETTLADAVTALDPRPLDRSRRSLSWWVSTMISIAILAVVVREIARVDFRTILAIIPISAAFWIALAANYFASPFCDWVIFRRLWHIPVSGFFALLRKQVGNELLLGYIGEVYFYTWARRQTGMTSAPFGAVKDVAILSALTGNIVTLVLLVLAYPLFDALHLGIDSRTLLLSVGVVLGTSSLMLLFRRLLFTLGRGELWFIGMVHVIRIIASTALTAWCWHLALPQVNLQWWLLLSSIRLLLGRLPLVPNKDIVFAGLAVFLIGHDAEIGALMTMMASLTLATHLAIGLALVAWEAASWRRA